VQCEYYRLALLAFDDIVVAATTFAAEKGGVFHRPGLARWLATSIIVLSLAAAALCLARQIGFFQ
jgi:hypothetical protein